MLNSRSFCLLLVLAAPAIVTGTEGSLIDPDNYRGIAADRRAYRVGDPLTVVVVENALAASSAGTGTAKDWDFGASSFRDDEVRHDLGIQMAGSADGTGRTTREGRLRAQLSVRVVSIENDDLLRVSGEQVILINGEQQTILVEGLVRREDIGPDNAVLSPRLSEARIEFTGDGVISEAQKRSWIYSLFNWLGLI